MTQLTIDPELGKDFDWAKGASYDMRVTGTVTAMTKDGGYTLEIESIEPEEMMPEEIEEPMPPVEARPRRSSPVRMMLGEE